MPMGMIIKMLMATNMENGSRILFLDEVFKYQSKRPVPGDRLLVISIYKMDKKKIGGGSSC